MALITRLLVAVFALALASAATGVAGAGTLSNPPSSVDQYVEILPTGDGNSTPGNKTTPLSHQAAGALSHVDKSTANALRTVAASSNYGAPPVTKPTMSADTGVSSNVPNASFAGSLKEVGGLLFSGGSRLLGLLLGLAAISLAVAIMTRRKNRSDS